MEWKVAAIVLIIQIIVSVVSYRWWKRYESRFPGVREELLDSLKSHLEKGTLEDFVAAENVVPSPLLGKQQARRLYLRTGLAMIVALAVSFLAAKVFASYLVLRAIVCTLVIMPFVHLLTKIIAFEADEIRIVEFQEVLRERIADQMAGGDVEGYVKELLEAGISGLTLPAGSRGIGRLPSQGPAHS
ncbi:MAG TPA: hypothetical protein PLM79_17560 [Syntrophobacteraceae bacterium]|nr:hypothetical protein [Syntrophobacteraceae bacterium]